MAPNAPQEPEAKSTVRGVEDEYSKIIDLHKFYLDIGTKTAAGSFTLIGAVVAFISQQDFPQARIPFALAIPLVLAVGNAVAFLTAIRFARDFKRQVEEVQRALDASWRPHVELLIGMNIVIGVLFSVLTVGLGCIVIWPDMLPQLPTK